MLAVLVVAGIYVPRSSWTHAKSPEAGTAATAPQNSMDNTATQSPAPSSQSSDMASPSAASSASPADSSAGTMGSNSTAPPAAPVPPPASVDSSNSVHGQMPPAAMTKSNAAHQAKKLAAQNEKSDQDSASPQAGEAASSGADTSAQLDEMEKTVDQLSNRAAAVNGGLDHLQQQQAASGYGLRSDMVERQASLKSNLYKAEEALQHRDLARAKKFADLAEADAEVLERFLGH